MEECQSSPKKIDKYFGLHPNLLSLSILPASASITTSPTLTLGPLSPNLNILLSPNPNISLNLNLNIPLLPITLPNPNIICPLFLPLLPNPCPLPLTKISKFFSGNPATSQ